MSDAGGGDHGRPTRGGGATRPIRPIVDQELISRAAVERALVDPDLKPLIERALTARGLTVEAMFPGGMETALWSKSYTESKSALLINPTTGDTTVTWDNPEISLTDVALLHKARVRKQ